MTGAAAARRVFRGLPSSTLAFSRSCLPSSKGTRYPSPPSCLGLFPSEPPPLGLCANPTAVGRRLVQVLASSASAAVMDGSAQTWHRSRAALIIIGNEILSGSIQDTNTHWLAKTFYSRGVDLVRVEVIPDDVEAIVETIHRLRDRLGEKGAIITSGGIGPTHDDVTYEAIAKAAGTTLSLHEPTVEKMRAHYGAQGKELNEARLRMAMLPQGAEILYTDGLWVPLVNSREVYVLPGIPRLFQGMLGANLDRFRGPSMHQAVLYTRMGEGDIAEALSGIASRFPAVSIGSYPNVSEDKTEFTTKLNFECDNRFICFTHSGRDKQAVDAAAGEAEAAFLCFKSPGC